MDGNRDAIVTDRSLSVVGVHPPSANRDMAGVTVGYRPPVPAMG